MELDALFWGPDWTPVPAEVFQERVAAAGAEERWVIDGNYSRVRHLCWPRATAIVWLDYSFPLVFLRALRRTIARALTKEELFSGNRESFRASFFSRESILVWVITTHRRNHVEYERILVSKGNGTERVDTTVHRLRHPRDAEALLADLEGRRLP
ncbi:MAG: hypothetical protein QUU85_04225 [Candidatus Eisenbacteria bacterium]|nr:hypothetical protein [Candidatus Eisenbacteria bacterium]